MDKVRLRGEIGAGRGFFGTVQACLDEAEIARAEPDSFKEMRHPSRERGTGELGR
jgi:hypothetical protein